MDVLVLSRFLPGSVDVLRHLRLWFPTTHIVLLVGTSSEQQRAYIKAARKYGLNNIVTGKLPGDRPYTIFTALKSAREPDGDFIEAVGVADEGAEESPGEETGRPGVVRHGEEGPRNVRAALEEIVTETGPGEVDVIRNKLKEILDMLDGGGMDGEGETCRKLQLVSHSPGHRSRGILVLTAANKGGVGKTTVAVTLAVALSRAGVPAVLVDYDLGAPDVASFFGIKDVPGMEVLAGRPVRQSTLKDLIIRRGELDILPGPMNRTLPNFKPGQLLEIASTLTAMYPVVVGDTPPEYWTKPWLAELFGRADYVLAVVDQSVLSERDTMSYAPYLLSMGVMPEKIGIV
ncbi:MAG: AAA family ATPase, partial [Desulfofundulus sp.]